MNVWTKRGYDIFNPVDAAGNPRKVINGEVQVWATEVERLFKAGSFNSVDAVGLYADRSTYDGEAEGFVYLSIDGDGAGSSSTVAFIKESAASGDWSPPVPFQGDKGWSPLFRVVNDGARRLLEVYDWIGGDGEKPDLIGYIGAAGLTANIAEAVDIRGPQGVSGSGLSWSFEAGTADEDPGAGKLRANAADLSAATELFVSKVSAGGDPVASFLAGLTNSTSTHKGYLILTEPSSGAQVTYDVTGTTDAAGYVKIAVSGHSGAAALTDAALLSVVFSRTGNAGDLNGVNPGTAGLRVLKAETGNEALDALEYQFSPSGPALSLPQHMRRRYVDVGAYCPLNDTADATAGVAAALADGDGREVVFTNPYGGKRNYIISSELALPANSKVIGSPGATLDFSTAGDNDLMFRRASTIAAAPSITADITAGDTIVQVSATAGLTEDSFVFISDNGIWSTADNSREGEWVSLKSIDSATQVTLYWGTLRSYTVANSATMNAYAMTQGLSLSGLSLRGKGGDNGFSNQRAIEISAADGLLIEGLDCDGFNRDNLQILRSIGWKVDSSSFNRSRTAGLAYGIVVASGSAWGLIDNVHGFDMRHVVTIGGTSGVNRHIHVRDSFGVAADFDAHPAAQFTTWERCETIGGVEDGIIDQGAHSSIKSCTSEKASRHGIFYNPLVTAAGVTSKVEIDGCTSLGSFSTGIAVLSTLEVDVEADIIGGESEAGNSSSVLLQLTADGSTLKDFGVAHHKARAAGAAHGVRVFMNSATAKCAGGRIMGSHVELNGTGSCIYLHGNGGGTIEDVSIVGCKTEGGVYGGRGIATDYIATSANRIKGATTAIDLAGANNSLGNDITG